MDFIGHFDEKSNSNNVDDEISVSKRKYYQAGSWLNDLMSTSNQVVLAKLVRSNIYQLDGSSRNCSISKLSANKWTTSFSQSTFDGTRKIGHQLASWMLLGQIKAGNTRKSDEHWKNLFQKDPVRNLLPYRTVGFLGILIHVIEISFQEVEVHLGFQQDSQPILVNTTDNASGNHPDAS